MQEHPLTSKFLTQCTQEEPDAKWPLLTLTRVQETLAALEQQKRVAGSACRSSAPREGANSVQHAASPASAAAEAAYSRLAHLDPLRRGYYSDAAAGLAHVVLRTASPSGS